MTPEEFQKKTGASQAAMDRLKIYERLLKEWNTSINLVSKTTIPDIWNRHFMDSAQLFPLLEKGRSLIDIGSGAGFPGLVLAALGAAPVSLCEKDTRKAAFLRTANAAMGLSCTIINTPIEAIKGKTFDIVTSRALADIKTLLALSASLRNPSTVCLFLKGKALDAELAEAQKEWHMDVEKIPSCTEEGAAIVRVRGIRPRAE